MRITFIQPVVGLGGGSRVVAAYARHLQELGHEVFSVSQPWQPLTGLKRAVRRLMGRPVSRPPARMQLLDCLGPRHIVLDRQRPPTEGDVPDADIIVATWWETAEWVAALPPSKGRKFYLLQDYEVFPNLPVDRVVATYHLPLTRIAVSGYIRDEITRNHGAQVLHVIPNSVDLAQFDAAPRAKPAAPTFGFLYTTTERKRIDLAIEALMRAKARRPDLRAEVFGAHPPHPSLPVPDWMTYHLAPPQSDIPKIYSACTAWLFTSDKEGFGLPILEAMACRTPVLATRAGAAPDLINGRNGILLPGTAEAFADEIIRFSDMGDDEWLACSKAARETVMSWSWQDATKRLIEIFATDADAQDARRAKTETLP